MRKGMRKMMFGYKIKAMLKGMRKMRKMMTKELQS